MAKEIYDITVAIYNHIYVEADDIEQAKDMVNEVKDDLDPDDFEDPEIDSWDAASYNPEAYMHRILTDKGFEKSCDVIDRWYEEGRL